MEVRFTFESQVKKNYSKLQKCPILCLYNNAMILLFLCRKKLYLKNNNILDLFCHKIFYKTGQSSSFSLQKYKLFLFIYNFFLKVSQKFSVLNYICWVLYLWEEKQPKSSLFLGLKAAQVLYFGVLYKKV